MHYVTQRREDEMTAQVPEVAQRLAGELADAFATDRGLAEQLTAARHRLQAANGRLWSGLHPDALGLVYDGAAVAQGSSAVAEGVGDAVRSGGATSEIEASVLSELQGVHWTIHRAFCELIAAFVSELIAAGWSEDEARQADVHQFASVASAR